MGTSATATRRRAGVLAQKAQGLCAHGRAALRSASSAGGAEGGDAVLYAASALFALLTALAAGLPGYRVWGWLALGPYAAAAAVSGLLAHRRTRRRRAEAQGDTARPSRLPSSKAAAAARALDVGPARVWLLLLVLIGATIVPLSVEVALRNDGPAISHVQPEVSVIANAGERLSHGQDPYRATSRAGRPLPAVVQGQPSFEAFFPYLPLMAAFGLPQIGSGQVRVTDTRVLFSIVTLVVVGGALLLARAPRDKKVRALQFLTVLPTAALPLATGGDDMPVVAFLLLAIVLAQRRRPGWSGIVLGVVSAMKFTAWPFAILSLFAARDAAGRRAPGRMLTGILAVAGPVVAPFALWNPKAFVDNVFLFPLGLAGVASPAASNLPGHLLVLHLPWLHDALPAAAVVAGGAFLLYRLRRHPPSTPAAVARLTAWVMLLGILLAPATRVGYLLYPADFFVWAWMLREEATGGLAGALAAEEASGMPLPASPVWAAAPPGHREG